MNRPPKPKVYNKILNLYALYNHASDWGTPEEYASCFSLDGRLVANTIDIRGRAALIEYKAGEQGRRLSVPRRHVNGSIVLAEQPRGHVVGICYLFAYNGSEDGLTLVDSGLYVDEIIKENGDWCFKSRTLRFDKSDAILPGERTVSSVTGDDALPAIVETVSSHIDGVIDDLGDLPVDIRPLQAP